MAITALSIFARYFAVSMLKSFRQFGQQMRTSLLSIVRSIDVAVRVLPDTMHVLRAQTKVYGADDFVGGEMRNGKWMRQGDFKALFVPPPKGAGKWELYNLAEDPGETRDLSGQKPELLKVLQTEWEHYAKDVGVVLTE